MKKYILILTSVCYLAANAQIADKQFSILKVNPESAIPRIAFFSNERELLYPDFEKWLVKMYHINPGYSFKLLTAEPDELGEVHYRLVQQYKGLNLLGTMLMVHTINGYVKGFNGLAFANEPVYNNSNFDEKKLEGLAREKFNIADALLNSTEYIYAPSNADFKLNKYQKCIAYSFYSENPIKGEKLYINSHGEIILTLPTIYEADSQGTVKTAYRGTQKAASNYSSNKFESKQNGRAVETLDGKNGLALFTSNSKNWNKNNFDSFAMDCYWATEKTWDMYKKWCGRNGLNNSGSTLTTHAHDGNYVNAFWNGSYAAFGDGDTANKVYPLTSIDVVGHEFTHGFTQNTCALVYSYQSGALNEGLSDVMGTIIEWYGDSTSGKFNWNMPSDIGKVFRNMKNPTQTNQPKYYLGQNWYTGGNDAGGVHTNSQVLNYWSYLLDQGDSGTNEVNYKFKVDSLGFYKTAKLAYRMMSVYLTSSSQYLDAGDYAMIAAADLWGTCGTELKSVGEACKTVGIIGNISIPAAGKADLSQSIINSQPSDTGVQLLQLTIMGDCNSGAQTLNKIYFNMQGSSSPTVSAKLKVWSTTSSKFKNATLLSTLSSPGNTFSLNFSKTLGKGFNYFWVTTDVKSTAKIGDIIDLGIDSIIINNIAKIPVTPAPQGYIIINYCIPPYTNPNSNTYMYCLITRFTLGTIKNYDSACVSGMKHYNYYNMSTPVERTKKYTANIITRYDADIAAWIDFNNNGIFESSEKVITGSSKSYIAYKPIITIPATAHYGILRMRVISQWPNYTITGPCDDYVTGQTQDYDLILIPQITSTTLCLGNKSTFTADYDSTLSYKWYENDVTLLKSGKGKGVNILDYIPTTAGKKKITLQTTTIGNITIDKVSIAILVYDTVVAKLAAGSNTFLCQGNKVTLQADTNLKHASANTLQINYNTALGKSQLANSNIVYMHAGLVDSNVVGAVWKKTVGTYWLDDGIGKMIPQGGGKFQLGIDILKYFSLSTDTTLKYMAVIFRNVDGTLAGKDSGGHEMFIDLRTSSPTVSYNAVGANYAQSYLWYLNNQVISGAVSSSLVVGNPGTYKLQCTGSICSSLSDSISVNVDSVPQKGTISSANNNVCEGANINLVSKGHTGTPHWEYDSNGNWQSLGLTGDSVTFAASVSGWYHAVYKSKKCYAVNSDSIYLNVFSKPRTGNTIVSDTVVCQNKSIILKTSQSNGNIIWQQDTGTGFYPTNIATDSGLLMITKKCNIRLLATKQNCIADTSVIYHIEVKPIPGITTSMGANPFCSSDSSWVQANLTSATAWQWYYNNTSFSSLNKATVKNAGIYEIIATHQNGCTANVIIKMDTLSSPVKPTIKRNYNTLWVDSLLYPLQQVSWYQGSTDLHYHQWTYLPNIESTYTAIVSNSNACGTSADAVNYLFSGLSVQTANSIQVYPNPFTDKFTIVMGENINVRKIDIIDASGNLVVSTQQYGKNTEINLSLQSNGLYLLLLYNADGTIQVIKLTKNN